MVVLYLESEILISLILKDLKFLTMFTVNLFSWKMPSEDAPNYLSHQKWYLHSLAHSRYSIKYNLDFELTRAA